MIVNNNNLLLIAIQPLQSMNYYPISDCNISGASVETHSVKYNEKSRLKIVRLLHSNI